MTYKNNQNTEYEENKITFKKEMGEQRESSETLECQCGIDICKILLFVD